MDPDTELILCPGNCGNRVHSSARECPRCGFESEMVRVEELLGSLSTVSSILTGFGLAALVQLATGESRNEPVLQWTVGLWTFSSLLLLSILVCSEFLRRKDVAGGRIRLKGTEENQLWRRSELLLTTFTVAVAGAAAGVVLLGFHFSIAHGLVASIAVVLGVYSFWRMF